MPIGTPPALRWLGKTSPEGAVGRQYGDSMVRVVFLNKCSKGESVSYSGVPCLHLGGPSGFGSLHSLRNSAKSSNTFKISPEMAKRTLDLNNPNNIDEIRGLLLNDESDDPAENEDLGEERYKLARTYLEEDLSAADMKLYLGRD
ncbi:hypothetical protein J437_LFUL005029 [Ladona fulva]|uniref:Uncharacterized protein n=1 Tax=Ladona fulva TaxID=123851 RepID=A0A8K0JYW2_LADFU|nr:hypothetical protein J437_LFUL005029 [Ladona fulva]